MGVLLVTLILWLTGNIHGIPAAAISFLPIMMLTMFGIVSGQDVRKLPWDTLMLVAGGLSLGLAIKETGLAQYFVGMINGYDLNFYLLLVVFSLLTITFCGEGANQCDSAALK